MSGIGDYRHYVLFQQPGPPVQNSDGGYTQSWTDLTPAHWWVSIDPATTRDLERIAAGTVISTATHIVKGKYHPQVNTTTRMIFGGRTFSITGKQTPKEQAITMELIAVEVVT